MKTQKWCIFVQVFCWVFIFSKPIRLLCKIGSFILIKHDWPNGTFSLGQWTMVDLIFFSYLLITLISDRSPVQKESQKMMNILSRMLMKIPGFQEPFWNHWNGSAWSFWETEACPDFELSLTEKNTFPFHLLKSSCVLMEHRYPTAFP